MMAAMMMRTSQKHMWRELTLEFNLMCPCNSPHHGLHQGPHQWLDPNGLELIIELWVICVCLLICVQ